MLVLSRRVGEIIHIGDDISLMVVRIGSNGVRIGIEAPRGVTIVRKELVDQQPQQNLGGDDESGQ